MSFISIGADPEFGFLKQDGEFKSAVNLYSGEDNIFGKDGCADIAELRPLPAYDPLIFTKNIRKALQSGYSTHKVLRDLHWKAGSMVGNQAIGGHIHLGGTPSGSRNKLVEALDMIVAPVSALLENRPEAMQRKATSYGGLNASRKQPWGIEYRTLASWLTSPKAAAGILTMCYAIASMISDEDFINDLSKGERLKKDEFNKHDKDAFFRCLESNFPILDAHMNNTPLGKYRKYILRTLRMIPTGWGHKNDMKKEWNLKKGLASV